MALTSSIIGRPLSSDGGYPVWHSVTPEDIPRTVDFGPTVGGRVLDALKEHGMSVPESRELLGLQRFGGLRDRDGPRVSGALVLAVAEKLAIDPYVLICGQALPRNGSGTEQSTPDVEAADGLLNECITDTNVCRWFAQTIAYYRSERKHLRNAYQIDDDLLVKYANGTLFVSTEVCVDVIERVCARLETYPRDIPPRSFTKLLRFATEQQIVKGAKHGRSRNR